MVLIRPARPDEALAIAQIHVAADGETYRPIFGPRFRSPGLEACLERWNTALAAGDDLIVAADRDRIVGFGHVAGDWMSALYLLASHHRRGVGRALLAGLRRRAAARGVAEVRFQCVADNAAAIAFYEAQGARCVGVKREGEGADAWDDVVLTLATDPAGASRDP